MRNLILLATVALPLAACSGAGAESAGSVAAPVGTPSTSVATGQQHSFVAPVDAKTYDALGGAQHFEYYTRGDRPGLQSGQLYGGDANTVRNGGITVSYDPRDAIFDVVIQRPKALVSVTGNRFQDPVHRTAFGGLRTPQPGVPQLDSARQIQYLQAGSSTGDLKNDTPANTYPQGKQGYSAQVQTFFYQKPGTSTKYVTYGGYVRNRYEVQMVFPVDANGNPIKDGEYLESSYFFDRGLLSWGERTDVNAVPKVGSGTYTGELLASMVYNALLDTVAGAPTYFQWIQGTHSTTVDFAGLGVTAALTGTVLAPTVDAGSAGSPFAIAAGSTFSASAKASIDLVGKGGFTGSFTDARFKPAGGGADTVLTIAGSSIDGAFFGPAGEELAAGFRVVGGKPDERIDILGVMTGKK